MDVSKMFAYGKWLQRRETINAAEWGRKLKTTPAPAYSGRRGRAEERKLTP